MAESRTSIANQALYLAGAERVDSIEDATPSAVVLNQIFDKTLEELITYTNWACCTFRQALAVASGDNFTEFDYKYQLPTDPLFLGWPILLDFSGTTPTYGELDDDTPFLIEAQVLYTDCEDVGLKYIGFQDDVSKLDSWMVTPLIYGLAAKACYRITEDVAKAAQLEQAYFQRRIEAATLDGQRRGYRNASRNRRTNAYYGGRSPRWDRVAGRGSTPANPPTS